MIKYYFFIKINKKTSELLQIILEYMLLIIFIIKWKISLKD